MRNCTTTKIRLARLEFDANNLRNSKRILESLTPTHNDHGGPPWEWKYLDGLLNASEHRWDMVIDGVEWIGALAYSPDGCLIAISNRVPKFDSTRFGTKGRITIRDSVTGNIKKEIYDVISVTELLYMDDGKVLVAVEIDMGLENKLFKNGPATIRPVGP